jgi:spermidine/putrescine transport system substrate-binding protein
MKKVLTCLLVLSLAAAAGVQAADQELYVYNWSEYMPEAVLQQFTEETGIRINLSTYDSNEAMYAKVRMMDAKGYDVIVPSTDFVARMRREELLQPLNKALLPNLVNISAKLLDRPFDPGNLVSVPYMWGSTAIAVNSADPVARTVKNLSDLWKPEIKGKLLLPNDMRSVIGLGLRKLGYSVNETDPARIQEACTILNPLVDNVRVFDSDSPKQALLNNEVQVAVLWNGEAYTASGENDQIRFIYPPEGFSLWLDSLCIPKGARNIPAAHTFIDFLLRPDVAAQISEELGYSSPNLKALTLLPDEVRTNPIVYPDDATTARGEFEIDLGEAIKTYERCWTTLKVGG